MKSNYIIEKLDSIIPNPKCELSYNKDYELLIATILSAQSTDKRVNEVTKVLFEKYDVFSLAKCRSTDIINIIYPVGTYKKKSEYIVSVCKELVLKYNGCVPNDRKFLESLPGVGRKTANVVLAELFSVPSIAVDTHVSRVSKRLGLTKNTDSLKIEKDLEKIFKKENWIRIHHQLVLFGRYYCKSKNPLCNNCPFKCNCKNSIIVNNT